MARYGFSSKRSGNNDEQCITLEGDILMSMYLSLKSKQIPLLIMLVDY